METVGSQHDGSVTASLTESNSYYWFATGSGDGCVAWKFAQSPAAGRRSNTQTRAEANEKQGSCRKKKEYVKCLENRVAVLENQNKTLIEELMALKDLYCHKAE
ncbi:hypothetical protein P7K49_039994 [Saguinus oedipus]|uniref:BZIP domain-containing protein n=1 Tax=Saguinus oedipus TaxID=9490 RepID=A0ABQ9TDU4_SAGOE|nr:hypothetical protein P7K49_040591 [Saguinus oedipus]KAK2082613.1 hypothetical protein P7K49_039994 [Saguinus oedipus]